MTRAIPFRGQGHVIVDMALTCGHTGKSEAANDGVTPVRTRAWCVDCQAFAPRAPEPSCVHADDDPGRHWDEDTFGNERRVECDCPCAACSEY
jgi:hypothetical protein